MFTQCTLCASFLWLVHVHAMQRVLEGVLEEAAHARAEAKAARADAASHKAQAEAASAAHAAEQLARMAEVASLHAKVGRCF